MKIVLILFFIALVGIAYMVLYKLATLRKERATIDGEEIILFTPDTEKIQYIAIKRLKEYGYVILLTTLRASVRANNILKRRVRSVYKGVNGKINSQKSEPTEQREISKFLRTVSDYKKKIRSIKHQIIEEERQR